MDVGDAISNPAEPQTLQAILLTRQQRLSVHRYNSGMSVLGVANYLIRTKAYSREQIIFYKYGQKPEMEMS